MAKKTYFNIRVGHPKIVVSFFTISFFIDDFLQCRFLLMIFYNIVFFIDDFVIDDFLQCRFFIDEFLQYRFFY